MVLKNKNDEKIIGRNIKIERNGSENEKKRKGLEKEIGNIDEEKNVYDERRTRRVKWMKKVR